MRTDTAPCRSIKFLVDAQQGAVTLQVRLIALLSGITAPNELSDIVSRPLLDSISAASRRRISSPIRRGLLQAHCYAIVVAAGLRAAYQNTPGSARGLHRSVSRAIATEEVGEENIGSAPSPRPPWGGHVTWRPDAFEGAGLSRQLDLVKRYMKEKDTLCGAALLCVALKLEDGSHGLAIPVLAEVRRHGDLVSYDIAGYRKPTQGEIEGWSSELEVQDATLAIARLSRRTIDDLVEAITSVQ